VSAFNIAYNLLKREDPNLALNPPFDDETSSEKASRMRRNLRPFKIDWQKDMKRGEPIRTDSGAYRNTEIYPHRAIKFAKYRSKGGRAAAKTDIAISHALASLGYPIVPEYPMAHDRKIGLGQSFPTEQRAIDLDLWPSMTDAYEALLQDPQYAHLNFPKDAKTQHLDRLHPNIYNPEESPFNKEQANALNEKLSELRDKRGRDIQVMHGAFEDYLPSALEIDDLHDWNIGRDRDDQSKFVTFDPMYGSKRRLGSISEMIQNAPSKNYISSIDEKPSHYANTYRNFYRAKDMNPMQFDNFVQLYRDTDIFEPWEKQAEETVYNPNFYPKDIYSQASYNRERKHNRKRLAADDADYKRVGDFFDFINVPDEQRRLFEYDTGGMGEQYRNMLEGLQSTNLKPYVPPQQFRDFREGGPSPVQKSWKPTDTGGYEWDELDTINPLIFDGRDFPHISNIGYQNIGNFDFNQHEGFQTGGSNRTALVGRDFVEKYPYGYGRAESKKDLAIFNALASLGYPIVPEQPMAFDKSPRFFPTRQEKMTNIDRDTLSDPDFVEAQRDFKNFIHDDPLTNVLDIGDLDSDNLGYDEAGELVAVDPFLGSQARLPIFGQMLDTMAAPIKGTSSQHYPKRDRPDYAGNQAQRTAADQAFLYQGFQKVPQMQKDSFRQLYHDQEQFSPWQAAEQKLFSDPEAFGEHAPTTPQREQMMSYIDRDDAAYKQAGRAIDFLTTPPEQKRLYEFGDSEHARRYRNMLQSLQSKINNPSKSHNWIPQRRR